MCCISDGKLHLGDNSLQLLLQRYVTPVCQLVPMKSDIIIVDETNLEVIHQLSVTFHDVRHQLVACKEKVVTSVNKAAIKCQ